MTSKWGICQKLMIEGAAIEATTTSTNKINDDTRSETRQGNEGSIWCGVGWTKMVEWVHHCDVHQHHHDFTASECFFRFNPHNDLDEFTYENWPSCDMSRDVSTSIAPNCVSVCVCVWACIVDRIWWIFRFVNLEFQETGPNSQTSWSQVHTLAGCEECEKWHFW